jgi:hypothetical protein
MKMILCFVFAIFCNSVNAQEYFTGTIEYNVDSFSNSTNNNKSSPIPQVFLKVSEDALLMETKYANKSNYGSQFFFDLISKKMYTIWNIDSSFSQNQLGDFVKTAQLDSTIVTTKILGYPTIQYQISDNPNKAIIHFTPSLIIKTNSSSINNKKLPSYVPLKINFFLKYTLVDSIEIALTAKSIQQEKNVDLKNYMSPYFAKAKLQKTKDSISKSQKKYNPDEPVKVYERVEISEELRGGFEYFVKKHKNIKSKDCACVVNFTVEKDGSVINPKIISTNCKKQKYQTEALRLVKLSSGKWYSKIINGNQVAANRTETINFK